MTKMIIKKAEASPASSRSDNAGIDWKAAELGRVQPGARLAIKGRKDNKYRAVFRMPGRGTGSVNHGWYYLCIAPGIYVPQVLNKGRVKTIDEHMQVIS